MTTEKYVKSAALQHLDLDLPEFDIKIIADTLKKQGKFF